MPQQGKAVQELGGAFNVAAAVLEIRWPVAPMRLEPHEVLVVRIRCSRYAVECEFGTLELDNRRLRVLSDLSGERVITEKPLAQQPAWTNAWLAEMYVKWLGGGDAPLNTLDDNIQCAALLFAAIESAHVGHVIDVQEYLQSNLRAVE